MKIHLIKNGVEVVELDVQPGTKVQDVAGNGFIVTSGDGTIRPPTSPVVENETLRANDPPKTAGR